MNAPSALQMPTLGKNDAKGLKMEMGGGKKIMT
jgi:hypothetical protein